MAIKKNRGSKKSSTTRVSKSKSRKKFKYKPRTSAEVKARAERSTGGFDRALKNNISEFRPSEGDNRIRILPPTWDNAEHHGFDAFMHYNIGPDEQNYLCPEKTIGKSCPICDEAKEAKKKGEDDYVKELGTSNRVAVYLIDRDKEQDGPKVWFMPGGTDKDLAYIMHDRRTGDVTLIEHPKKGYDIEFTREGTGLKTKYKGLKIVHRPSPLSDDSEVMGEWLNFIMDNPLPEALKFYSYDYMTKVFGGEVEREDEEEEEEDDVEKEGAADDDVPTEDEVDDMDSDDLDTLIDDLGLDVDTTKFADTKKGLKKLQQAVWEEIASQFPAPGDEEDEEDDADEEDEEDEDEEEEDEEDEEDDEDEEDEDEEDEDEEDEDEDDDEDEEEEDEEEEKSTSKSMKRKVSSLRKGKRKSDKKKKKKKKTKVKRKR